MTAKALANRLASVPERAMEAIPNLPEIPWRRRRSALPAPAAAFGLGLVMGLGLALLLYLSPQVSSLREEAGADPRPDANPIQ
jgi:hypothetical protein